MKNRISIVTGGGAGIGLAIVRRFLQDGYRVLIGDRAENLPAIVGSLQQQYADQVQGFHCDVVTRHSVRALVEEALRLWGRLDIMVNNAGICLTKRLDDTEEADLEKLYKINVFGVIYGIQEAARAMRTNGGGKIINACSIAGYKGFEHLGAYCGTKFAVRALTQTAAQEYAKDKITVNAYCPGVVRTDMWREIDKDLRHYHPEQQPMEAFEKFGSLAALGRPSEPEDVAKLVAYLASEDADFMTGQAVIQDGGIIFS